MVEVVLDWRRMRTVLGLVAAIVTVAALVLLAGAL